MIDINLEFYDLIEEWNQYPKLNVTVKLNLF